MVLCGIKLCIFDLITGAKTSLNLYYEAKRWMLALTVLNLA